MSEIKNGGPAFPMPANEYAGHGPAWGITARDYFAAKAMQGYLASFSPVAEPAEFASQIADDAYTLADAMLAAREQQS